MKNYLPRHIQWCSQPYLVHPTSERDDLTFQRFCSAAGSCLLYRGPENAMHPDGYRHAQNVVRVRPTFETRERIERMNWQRSGGNLYTLPIWLCSTYKLAFHREDRDTVLKARYRYYVAATRTNSCICLEVVVCVCSCQLLPAMATASV